MFKYVAFILMIFLLSACGPKVPFVLQNATSTKWMAGKEDGINGTDYNIFVTLKSGYNADFDSIWMGGKGTTLESKKLNNNIFELKGTIVERGNSGMGVTTSVGVTPPKPYKGKALIRYTHNRQIRYFEIKEFSPTEPIYMP